MIENISLIQDCYQQWLQSISTLNDLDLINEIKKGTNCLVDNLTIIKSFNFNPNWVSISIELPESVWSHQWNLIITSSR